jgi:hypothetical protein
MRCGRLGVKHDSDMAGKASIHAIASRQTMLFSSAFFTRLRQKLSARLTAFLVAVTALARFDHAAAAEASFDASTGFSYNSNLSNADRASDVYDDFFWNADGGVSWDASFGRDWRGSAGFFAGVEVPFEYSAFTLARVGVDARMTRKFGLGTDAPRLTIGTSFERDFFQQTEMSKWLLVPSVRWVQPLGEAWSADLLFRFDGNFADSTLFSGYGNEGGLTFRWRPEGRWSFSGGYRLRYGDVVSFATPPRPDILSIASAVDPENTFFGPTLTAYRIQALTQSFVLGASVALTEDVSLETTGELQRTSRSAISYDAFLVRLALKAVF